MARLVLLILMAIWGTCSGARLIRRSATGLQVFLDMEGDGQARGDNRGKRATEVTGLTEEEHTQAEAIHNTLRAQEGASNMITLQKNQALADMAQEWAETCKWEHGQPNWAAADRPYNQIGQNLHMVTGDGVVLDVVGATGDWYSEKQFYAYDSLSCEAGQVCGHYTQVVWADTEEIGCGAFACDVITETSTGTTWNNAIYIVCNYGPPGNFANVKPFLQGTPCTKCGSGQMTCYQDLCYESCEEDNIDCECAAECDNCGEVTEDCRCSCTDGWFGNTCSQSCVNTGVDCEVFAYSCTDPVWREQMESECPVTCGVCFPLEDGETVTCPGVTETTTLDQNKAGSPNIQPSIFLVFSLLSILVFTNML